MSDTPRTDRLKARQKLASANHAPLPYGYLYKAALEIAEKEERENTALRAHAERLAGALEETLDLIDRCSIDETPRDFHETKQESYKALTLYRAENPKV